MDQHLLYQSCEFNFTMSFGLYDNVSHNTDNLSTSSTSKWTEVNPTLKSATPSVIRKGLCMLRDKGNKKGI